MGLITHWRLPSGVMRFGTIWPVEVVDDNVTVIARVEKTLYIRRMPASDKLASP